MDTPRGLYWRFEGNLFCIYSPDTPLLPYTLGVAVKHWINNLRREFERFAFWLTILELAKAIHGGWSIMTHDTLMCFLHLNWRSATIIFKRLLLSIQIELFLVLNGSDLEILGSSYDRTINRKGHTMSVIAQTLPIPIALVFSYLGKSSFLGDLLVWMRQDIFSCNLLEIHCAFDH